MTKHATSGASYRGACAVAVTSALLLAGCGRSAEQQHHTAAAGDSAFRAMQARGASMQGMGVDQYTSVHRFDALPDGGRIELQRDTDDTAGIAQIRRHLHQIATAFAAGDFSTPAFVHMTNVPGASVLAARRQHITYEERDLPRGGEVRITTHDPQALAAVHDFLAFQRGAHHAGGMTGMGGMHDTAR